MVTYSDNRFIKSGYLGNREIEFLSPDRIKQVVSFFQELNEYNHTPLVRLSGLAAEIGVRDIYIKDESKRFSLDSFKALGGMYAISKLLAEIDHSGELTFVTATDGNHGKGVTWAARKLGHQAIIYFPKGAAHHRVKAIKDLGGEAIVTDMNYDDTVTYAIKQAEEHGWLIVQDTAWEGYYQIPRWIMQGYAVMCHEIENQLLDEQLTPPTHVFLQAGVGSLAGAVIGYYQNHLENPPTFHIIEPDNAACMFESQKTSDGRSQRVEGDLDTIMAGLSCGEPSPIGWKIMREYADSFLSCPDWISARGMRILSNPVEGDDQIKAGESGGIGLGLVSTLTQFSELGEIKEKLNLDQDARILLINTEGVTDPVNYQKVIWDGAYSVPDFIYN